MTALLRPMRTADLGRVMELEEELFAPDTWTAAMYREELALTDTRHYLVAEDDGAVVGYAGLIAYDDEAHVATIGVTGSRPTGTNAAGTRYAAGSTPSGRPSRGRRPA